MNKEQYMNYDMIKNTDISGPTIKRYYLKSPLYIDFPRKKPPYYKRYALNINTYRNLPFIVNSLLKKEYKRLMEEQINNLPQLNKIKLEFILHKSSNRKIDRHNICSVIQKFFCDSLVELGRLEGDDDRFIEHEKYTTGTIEKNNGYCEIVIDVIN